MTPITISNFQLAINVVLSDHLRRREHYCLVPLAVRFARVTARALLVTLLGEEDAGDANYYRGKWTYVMFRMHRWKPSSTPEQGAQSSKESLPVGSSEYHYC